MNRNIEVRGARENNLKNISIDIPKDQLVVFTGVSGSGKSSLAFDTIYAEGQRRYLDTFSAYARQMIGTMEKPDVDSIDGMSPVISIEQKSSGWNPRSTVGTVTEIYDFLRLLYARIADAYSYDSGIKMVQYTEDQINRTIVEEFNNEKIMILGPVVKGRKGHYRELFEHYRKLGYTKAMVDGDLVDIEQGMRVDRYTIHDINIVIDRFTVVDKNIKRIRRAVQAALKMGKETLFVKRLEDDDLHLFSKMLVDPATGIAYDTPSPNTFSFNSPYGYCPNCKGMGTTHEVDLSKVIPDNSLSIGKGGIVPIGEERDNNNFKALRKLTKKYKFSFATPIKDIPKEVMDMILFGENKSKKNSRNEEMGSFLDNGLVNMISYYYEQSSSEGVRRWAGEFLSLQKCTVCNGARLNIMALHFKIGAYNIAELGEFDLEQLSNWLENIDKELSKKQKLIGGELIKEIKDRVNFLLEVGLNYLNLNRPANTLSGGESQRTRLATQIGSKLTGITYILDEPSIGLHARDNERLINALKDLTKIGNSVLVVEHDKEIMLSADFLIDIGPGAGEHGGEIVAQGKLKELKKNPSATVEYLFDERSIEVPKVRRKGSGEFLHIFGASGNNLQNIDVEFPLGTFTCVTGVSGSGKSSLIHQTLFPLLKNHLYKPIHKALPYKELKGLEHIDKVIEIDQKPIGRTPRSNPATYTKLFDEVRTLFSMTPDAKIRGYKKGRFSFNVKGGRCEACGGAGRRVIEMNFLPDVMIECETCLGKRYNRETLEILYKGKSIYDVLEMSVEEAADFFEAIPKIKRKLVTLKNVGLGYIRLGQPATTLSGGEAQRVKLAEELSKKATGSTFYIMDEPTTGLHFQDIEYLLQVINKLVDKGNTVVVIEHNLDVVKCADYIIDIGPEGGAQGGKVVATGTPESISKKKKSYTGKYLKAELK